MLFNNAKCKIQNAKFKPPSEEGGGCRRQTEGETVYPSPTGEGSNFEFCICLGIQFAGGSTGVLAPLFSRSGVLVKPPPYKI